MLGIAIEEKHRSLTQQTKDLQPEQFDHTTLVPHSLWQGHV